MRALGLLRAVVLLSLPPNGRKVFSRSFALEQYDEIERDGQTYRGRW